MEFVQGQTLEDVLQPQGTFSARETVLVGEDVCRALAAVHNAGFVHRDVKARNVMREQAGRIVLMDFGTGREARALEDPSRPDVAGTPLYMAPEVLAGEPASMRSDVYAVGVLLYHLVTSEYPIVAQSIDELRAAHKAHRRRYLERDPAGSADAGRAGGRTRALRTSAGSLSERRRAARRARHGARRSARFHAGKPRVRCWPTAAAIALIAVLPVLLGFLTTIGFNAILQRQEFANETVWDWWIWGARAVISPVMSLLIAGFAFALFAGRAQPAARGVVARQAVRRFVRPRAAAWANRLSMDDVSVLSSWVFLLSTTALVVTWWYFWPLMAAFAKTVSAATSDRARAAVAGEQGASLRVSQGADADRPADHGRLVRRVESVGAAPSAPPRKVSPLGGAAVLGLAIVSLVLPYRLLYHNRRKRRSGARQNRVLLHHGRARRRLLLFCPGPACPQLTPSRATDVARRAASRTSSPSSARPRRLNTRPFTCKTSAPGRGKSLRHATPCITLTLCLLVQAAAPPAAQAWLWEYFEELSGPGPFTGLAFEWRRGLLQRARSRQSRRRGDRRRVEARDGEARAVLRARLLLQAGAGAEPADGVDQPEIRPSSTRRTTISSYRSDRISRDVKLTTLTPSVAWRPVRSVRNRASASA